MATNTQTLSTEDALRLVAHRRRRLVISRLREFGDDAVTLDELAESVAASESQSGAVSPRDRKLVAVSLHHVQLPKLDAAGVVEYDARDSVVRYCPVESVERLVRSVDGEFE